MHSKMKRTWQTLTADKRRFSLFCTLLFVGLLLWARIIVIARPARTAIAAPIVVNPSAEILYSDNLTTPAYLEAVPRKNPFEVNSTVFPEYVASPDNIHDSMPVLTDSTESGFVATLKLEAIMGEMAVINGQVVSVGGIIGSQTAREPLRLSAMQGRTVIISAGDRRYELSIAPLHQ